MKSKKSQKAWPTWPRLSKSLRQCRMRGQSCESCFSKHTKSTLRPGVEREKRIVGWVKKMVQMKSCNQNKDISTAAAL